MWFPRRIYRVGKGPTLGISIFSGKVEKVESTKKECREV